MENKQSYKLQDIDAKEGMVLVFSDTTQLDLVPFTKGNEYTVEVSPIGTYIVDEEGEGIYTNVKDSLLESQDPIYSYSIFDDMYFYIKDSEDDSSVKGSIPKDKDWPQVGDNFMFAETVLSEEHTKFIGQTLTVVSKVQVPQHEEPIITFINEDGAIDCTLGDHFIEPVFLEKMWTPKRGEQFYIVDIFNMCNLKDYRQGSALQRTIDAGNCYKTKLLAERAAERRKRIGVFENKMLEFSEGYKYKIGGDNFFVRYSNYSFEWEVIEHNNLRGAFNIYMTEQQVKKAVEWANKYYPNGL